MGQHSHASVNLPSLPPYPAPLLWPPGWPSAVSARRGPSAASARTPTTSSCLRRSRAPRGQVGTLGLPRSRGPSLSLLSSVDSTCFVRARTRRYTDARVPAGPRRATPLAPDTQLRTSPPTPHFPSGTERSTFSPPTRVSPTTADLTPRSTPCLSLRSSQSPGPAGADAELEFLLTLPADQQVKALKRIAKRRKNEEQERQVRGRTRDGARWRRRTRRTLG